IDEVDTIGFDDMIENDGVLVIEWAERITDALPEKHLWIELRVIEELRRSFILESNSDHYKKLVDAFRKIVFGG
ncbi:MAG: tRNA (adenosine(37)-N6)-threonylcarbamoyltransferase complex ATPase subunit type 1 TsaE, partial [Chloroflexota bacterium]